MGQVSRRGLLVGLASGAVAGTFSPTAAATVMRALTLESLVQGSRRIVVVTALDAESHFEELGWTVEDATPVANETKITFSDDKGDIQAGSVQSQPFDKDDTYTETRIQFNMAPSAVDGGGDEGETPEPTAP